MRAVDELNQDDNPVLGPFDFLYIDSWEDLSMVGTDLHKTDRIDCKDDINNFLDIMFVQCSYENRYIDDEETRLVGSLVAIVPYAKMSVDNQVLRDELCHIATDRGYGANGVKTAMDPEETDEIAEE